MTQPQVCVAFDCESTGFPPMGRLVELAAVPFLLDGTEPFEAFQRLVRPPIPIPQEISELTGLTDDVICRAATAPVVLSEFRLWLPEHAIFVAHNLPFDLAILSNEQLEFSRHIGRRAIDSLPIARALGEFPDNRLTTIADALRLSTTNAHRALADARTVKQLVLHATRRGLPKVFPELFSSDLYCLDS